MKKLDPPIRVSAIYPSPIAQVWEVITRLDHMQQWFFPQINAFHPQLGFKTQFKIQVESSVFTHLWEVLSVHPEEHLQLRWRYLEYPGDSTLSFHLKPEGDSTQLEVIAVVLSDFPNEIPEFTRESCKAGWKYFIPKQLPKYLVGLKS